MCCPSSVFFECSLTSLKIEVQEHSQGRVGGGGVLMVLERLPFQDGIKEHTNPAEHPRSVDQQEL